MKVVGFTLLGLLLFFSAPFLFSHQTQANADKQHHDRGLESSSPFEIALQNLQAHIGYTFKNIDLLRRAMTHASFSEENNKALSVVGSNVIDAAVSLQSLRKNIDMSSKELNNRIAQISNVESSCAADGTRLGLQKVIRVSFKTNTSGPGVVCGAFRAIFGAIAIDTEKCDDAGSVFWKVHQGVVGAALAL